ncbi:MAG: hypothetical protein ACREQ7_02310 [Candidatus Binatia bacterium]
MGKHNSTPPRDNPDVSHEQSDVNIRWILGFGIGLIITIGAVQIGLYWLLDYQEKRSARSAPAVSALIVEEQIPSPPNLQVSPRADLDKMRAAEEKELQTYGWVDQDKKIVRIPIDRAIELLAERGLPARKQELTKGKEKQGKKRERR